MCSRRPSRAPKERRTVFLGAECDANPLNSAKSHIVWSKQLHVESHRGDESFPSVGHSAHHVAVERSAVQRQQEVVATLLEERVQRPGPLLWYLWSGSGHAEPTPTAASAVPRPTL